MYRCVPSGRSRGRQIQTIVAGLAAIALVGPVGAASAQTALDNGYGTPGTGKQVLLPTNASGGPAATANDSTPATKSKSPSSGPSATTSSTPVAVSAGSSNGVGSLPFTGLDLAPLLLVALGVLGLGFGLRRMTSRTAPHSDPRG